MADEAKNGIPDVDKSPEVTENEENEVKSPIVMRIDAPDSAPAVDTAPAAFSFSGARDFSSRGFPSRNFPAMCSPSNRAAPSSNNHPFSGLGGRNVSFSGLSGAFGAAPVSQPLPSSPSCPRPLLLRPSSLAVNSGVSSTEPDEGAAGGAGGEASGSKTTNPTTTTQVKFVPLALHASHKDDSGSVGGASGGVSSSVSGFVFGQNLRARAAPGETPDSTSAAGATSAASTSSWPTPQVTTTNGIAPSEMLFTSVIRSEPNAADSSVGGAAGGSGGPAAGGAGGAGGEAKSLSEAAAEYEEARAVKRTYERVAIFTGEEGEENIAQVNCKLFAYDGSSGQYVERGRVTLRLNDRNGPDGTHSRVVMRTAGSLRVVLNTEVWAGMLVDRASPKSVRITAMEPSGQITVFLVMASSEEMDALCKSLKARVAKRQASLAEKQATVAERRPADSQRQPSAPEKPAGDAELRSSDAKRETSDAEPAAAKRSRADESTPEKQ